MLWRNRDFVLLQLGQLLSTAGTSATAIAYPLLVLAVSHGPAKAGLAGICPACARRIVLTRRRVGRGSVEPQRLMIAADVVRASAIGGLPDTEAHGEIDETFASRRLRRWLRGMFGGGQAVEKPPEDEREP